MTVHDGNGWAWCDRGHRHWGRYGAAGLLVAAPDATGQPAVLLHQRSWWVSHGGSWGPPGGARDSHESELDAALREAAEECGIDPAQVTVHGVLPDDHGGWTYRTVLGYATRPFTVFPVSEETKQVAWVSVDNVASLRLHPGFAEQWSALRTVLMPVTIIVDAANVIGSRPDGWWRDRVGAARRLLDELSGLALDGVTSLPESLGEPVLERWYPKFVVVLEGAAARSPVLDPTVLDPPVLDPTVLDSTGQPAETAGSRLSVVRTSKSGDDAIVKLAEQTDGQRLVVTADRELRARCEAVGASVIGPRWLLSLL